MKIPQDAPVSPERLRSLNPLQLAYVGDTVYDLYVRSALLANGDGVVKNLHAAAVRVVCAKAQAEALARVEDMLSSEEADIVRRGRNAHPRNVPRSADPGEYAKATALEALAGFLYLSGRHERLDEIMHTALGEGESCQGQN